MAQPAIGIKVGAGLSTPSISAGPNAYPESSNLSRIGLVWGIYSQFPLNANWLVQPGVHISSKGFKEKYSGSSYAAPNKLAYLEVPLNFVHSSKQDGNGFQAGLGPVVSFLIEKRYLYYPVRETDVGLNVLLGYKVPIGFSLQLNYTHGFIDVIKDPSVMSSMKNRFLALTAGYLF